MAVAYKLYATQDGKPQLVEEATEEQPFTFISGIGHALDAFEQAVAPLQAGEPFDFTLTADEAYGEYAEERVVELDKQLFSINGQPDDRYLHVGASVPMQNEQGQHFIGHVKAIGTDTVSMDFNHPLAGKSLRFEGHVVESRDVSEEELQQLLQQAKGCGGCKGCGNDCSGGCHDGHGDSCSCDKK